MVVVVVELEALDLARFAVVVVLFVVQVQSQTMMMKNLKRKKRKNLLEFLELVVLLLALHVHEFVGLVFRLLLLQALSPVVGSRQTHPLVVVPQLAYGLQFFLQQQLVWLPSLHTWIQSCRFDSTD